MSCRREACAPQTHSRPPLTFGHTEVIQFDAGPLRKIGGNVAEHRTCYGGRQRAVLEQENQLAAQEPGRCRPDADSGLILLYSDITIETGSDAGKVFLRASSSTSSWCLRARLARSTSS
jgi:hypothetical protein